MNLAMRDKAPSIEQCYKLLKKYDVPDNIVQHSEMVYEVAVFLADKLNRQGENLRIPEIEAAALLHDMAKMEGLKTGQDHAKACKNLLDKLGFKRIGEIVGEHIELQQGRSSQPLSEEELIYYSDRRVMHSKVVTLEERFADLRMRCDDKGSDKNAIKRAIELENETYELEKKIFSKLDFTPEDLPNLSVSVSNNPPSRGVIKKNIIRRKI